MSRKAAARSNVKRVKQKRIRDGSKSAYAAPQRRFVEWLLDTHEECVHESIRNALVGVSASNRKKSLSKLMKEALAAGTPLLVFDMLRVDDVEDFFGQLKKENGQDFSLSACGTARSAVLNLFATFQVPVPLEMTCAVADFWKGLKRDYVDKKRLGGMAIEEGSGVFAH
jgi:hypothetical protein